MPAPVVRVVLEGKEEIRGNRTRNKPVPLPKRVCRGVAAKEVMVVKVAMVVMVLL
jgi:hypothetical protein